MTTEPACGEFTQPPDHFEDLLLHSWLVQMHDDAALQSHYDDLGDAVPVVLPPMLPSHETWKDLAASEMFACRFVGTQLPVSLLCE